MPPWKTHWWKKPPWETRRRFGIDRIELAPDPPMITPPAGPLPPPGPGWEPRTVPSTGVGVWTSTAADPQQALAVWQDRRERHRATGWWPVLVDDDFWDAVAGPAVTTPEPAGSGAEWLSRRLYGGNRPLADRVPRGSGVSWPPSRSKKTLMKLTNPASLVDVVLVPAAAPWLVPETLGWSGAASYDTWGPQHTLVLRRWAGRYGAEPLSLSSDELMLRINQPPGLNEEAWLAALEAVAYCPETVGEDQGETLEGQVGAMVRGIWWFFFDLDEDDDED